MKKEAEEAVLGGLLLVPEKLGEVAAVLAPADFLRPAHATIFQAMLLLERERSAIDVVTLVGGLKAMGSTTLDEVGGIEYLGRLATAIPSIANLDWYVKEVKAESNSARLARCAANFTLAAQNGEVVAGAKATLAEIETILAGVEKANVYQGMELATLLEKGVDLWLSPPSTPVGFGGLEEVFPCGLVGGELIVIAGMTGMGKTSFMTSWLIQLARKGIPTAFLSAEMSAQQVLMKIGCQFGKINARKIREIGAGKFISACAWLAQESRLTLVDRVRGQNLPAEVKRVARLGAKVVFVDYLQLLTVGSGDLLAVELEAVSRALKLLAEEFKITVVLGSQINREFSKESSKKPQEWMIKGSGGIAQVADVTAGVFRPAKVGQGSDFGQTTLMIWKNRNWGWTGEIDFQGYPQFEGLVEDKKEISFPKLGDFQEDLL